MRTSQAGITLIESFEGCELTAYQDSSKVWTIGYGHTADVCDGMTITQQQADAFLADDLQATESYVDTYVKVPLMQHQFDALVSFTYNLGPGTLQHSNVLAFINASRFQQAADALLDYDQADGVVLAGLRRRRQAERSLFLSSIVPDWFDRVMSWLFPG